MNRLWTGLSFALLACADPPAEAEPESHDLGDRVAWAPVAVPTALEIATLPAEVIAAPGRSWTLGPPVAGRIVRWAVRPGASVRAGDVLAELSSPEVLDLDGQITALSAQAKADASRVEIAQAAVDAGAGTALALRDAQAAHAGSQAALAAASQRRRGIGPSAGAGAWTWTAPADGLVAEVRCGLDVVSAQAPCLRLIAEDAGLLQLAVPERLLAQTGTALQATLTTPDGLTWTFTEADRAPQLDPDVRARRFWLRPEGAGPLIGASGRATIRVPAPADAVSVPADALTLEDGRPIVLLASGDLGTPTPVERLGRDGDQIVVRGLPANAQVAVRGVQLLRSLALVEGGGHH